jgi:hypothetical protein
MGELPVKKRRLRGGLQSSPCVSWPGMLVTGYIDGLAFRCNTLSLAAWTPPSPALTPTWKRTPLGHPAYPSRSQQRDQ